MLNDTCNGAGSGGTMAKVRSSHLSSSSSSSQVLSAATATMMNIGPSRSADEQLCRICQYGPSNEELLSPCQCKGTLALVHRTCLEMWLSQSNRTTCEICMTPYEIHRTAMTFLDFLRNPTTLADRRNIVADCICFTILLPLSAISSWMCVNGATHYLTENINGKGKYEAIGLIIVTMLLLMIFAGWSVIAIRYHWAVWREWRDTHFRVCLLRLNDHQHRAVDHGPENSSTPGMVAIHYPTGISVRLPSVEIDKPAPATGKKIIRSAYMETGV